MDWEIVFYIIAAIIFVLVSAFRGKKKYEQESDLLSEQVEQENAYFDDMLQNKGKEASTDDTSHEEETDPNEQYQDSKEREFYEAQKPMQSELQKELNKNKESEPEQEVNEEIDTVKREIQQKRKVILDLRKAVIYETLLNRKYH